MMLDGRYVALSTSTLYVALSSVKQNGETAINVQQCKWILKCYWKVQNMNEVQKHWRNESGTPQTCVAIAQLCDKFEN
jgi:hypothetical protein